MATKDKKDDATPKAEQKERPALPKEQETRVESGEVQVVQEDTYKGEGPEGRDVHVTVTMPVAQKIVRLVSLDAAGGVFRANDGTEYRAGDEMSEGEFNSVLANEKDRNGQFLFKAEEV